MKPHQSIPFPLIFAPLIRRWAPVLAALLASAAPGRADHLYNAWTKEYDLTATTPQAQEARAVVTDSHGNVCVAGESIDAGGIREWYVAKYDALDGHLLASTALGPNNPGYQQAAAPSGDSVVRSMAVDSQDNIIVAGGATFANEDFEVIKFYPDLTQQHWARAITNSGLDEVAKVVVAADDSVYVVGQFAGSGQGANIHVIHYRGSDGFLLNQVTYNSSGNIDDIPVDMAVDSSGLVWVTGYSQVSSDKVAHTLQLDLTAANPLLHDFVHSVTGGDSVPAGIVLDSAGHAFITTTDVDNSGNHSFYTAKYTGTSTSPVWSNSYAHTADDGLAKSSGIAIGSDGNPIVSGTVDCGDNFDITEAVLLKYSGASGGAPTWTTLDIGRSSIDSQHPGFPAFSTASFKVHVDDANNVIITGTSQGPDDANSELYLAKFNGTDGTRIFDTAFDGSSDAGEDDGVDVATDAAGNIALCGTESAIPPGASSNSGIHRIVTQKYNRIIAETNDPLPPDGSTPRTLTLMDAAALADTGDLATKITFTENKKKFGAILKQDSAGASQLVAIQNQAAPGASGGLFSTFGDPIISPDGHIAFLAKLTGTPGAQANGLWTDLSGTLAKSLQQGTPLPGLTTVNVSTIMSVAMRDAQLLALVKVTGPAPANIVLVSLDAANNGTKLLQTNDPITVNGTASTIKTITVLSPPPNEAGAGNWQGDGNMVVEAVLADKRTVVCKVTSAGTLTPLLFTGGNANAVTTGATWKSFAFPAIGPDGSHFATFGTINADKTLNITTKGDTAIVYSDTGGAGTFSLVAREGSPSPIANTSYATLGTPLTSSTGQTTFLATLETTPGSTTKLATTANHVVMTSAAGTPSVFAHSGDPAPTIPADTNTQTFSSFTSLAMLSGSPTEPLFVAKLAGKTVTGKNNLALFTKDSSGNLRRLFRTGDQLGTQVVTGFTLLNPTPQAFSAVRSFNTVGGIVLLVTFSDHTTGIVELSVP